jgi:phosphoribosyl 1,2-cyclic phosphodiesterase
MEVILHGARGTIPVPGPSTVRYGGNTPSIEVRSHDGHRLFLDAGTGLHIAGRELVQSGWPARRPIHLALSHTHWDHIEGFPLFAPLYVRDGEPFHVVVYGSANHVEAFLHLFRFPEGRPFFPVSIQDMPGRVETRATDDLPLAIGDLYVDTAPLPHPGGCTGYRIMEQSTGAVLTYCTDTEHPDEGFDESVLRLANGAYLFLYDATFTPEEYEDGHQGWGHSTWLRATQIARECNAQRLLLFHHAPEHDDDALEAILAEAKREFPATDLATEGHHYTLP